jgi:hypothetical protein
MTARALALVTLLALLLAAVPVDAGDPVKAV